MPIIAVGIVNKQGKIVLSRQFTDISRIRIEGLLSAFPRLLSTAPSGQQVTFIETGSVRYVYQPLESLLMVLVTTKGSNIVEDLATLRMMGRLIPEYVEFVHEQALAAKAFEVLFAFDEVVVNGHCDNNTLEQITTYLAMESHEEEVAKAEKMQQEAAAKKQAEKRAAQIRQQKREGQMLGGIGSHNTYGGVGSDGPVGGGGGASMSSLGSDSGNDGFGGGGGVGPASSAVDDSDAKPAAKPSGGMGLSLTKARKADAASRIMAEAGVSGGNAGGGAPAAAAPSAPAPATNPAVPSSAGADQGPIHLKIVEKISATLNRDGGITALDVRGDLSILISDASLANVRVLLKPFNDAFVFKTHTKINKDLFTSDRMLSVKDGKSYPAHQPLEIVRWRMQNGPQFKAPITVNCWPGEGSASVEYELENTALTLRGVRIWIPVGAGQPSFEDCTEGDASVQGPNVCWYIPEVSSSNNSGSIEMNFANALDTTAFFPIKVEFQSDVSLANVAIAGVVNAENGVPAPFSCEIALASEDYVVS